MTYLQILNLIKDTALAQPNVNTVVREFIDLNREDTKYSAVVIQDRDGLRDRIVEQDYITYTWHLGYVDRLTYDESNRDDIFSTGINVINNIVNSIRNTYFPTLEVRVIDRFNTFNQRFTASCAGVYVVLAIDVAVSDCVDGEMTDMYDSYSVKITENGDYHIVPDGKPVDEIDITVDVAAEKPEEHLVETITSNGVHNFWPSTGSVFRDAEITVDVPVKEEEDIDIQIINNGVETWTPESGKVWKKVRTEVNVHPSLSLTETYTSNGVYPLSGEWKDGEITVAVSQAKPEEVLVETITSNGSYSYSPTPGSVFSSVALSVNCPGPKPEMTGRWTFDSNGSGTLKPMIGYVFDAVDYDVDVHPSSSLVETITSNGVTRFSGEWKDAEITVAVSQAKPEETLSETITSNGSYSYSPTPGSVFSSVALSVDVHPSDVLDRTYTTNGRKTITGEFNGGSIFVNVHPSASFIQTFTSNGTTSFSGEWRNAEVTISVPSTTTLTVTQAAYNNLSVKDPDTIYLIYG